MSQDDKRAIATMSREQLEDEVERLETLAASSAGLENWSAFERAQNNLETVRTRLDKLRRHSDE